MKLNMLRILFAFPFKIVVIENPSCTAYLNIKSDWFLVFFHQKKSLIEDPFDNEEHERHEVEMLAKKFETKYVSRSVEIVVIKGMNPDNFSCF